MNKTVQKVAMHGTAVNQCCMTCNNIWDESLISGMSTDLFFLGGGGGGGGRGRGS